MSRARKVAGSTRVTRHPDTASRTIDGEEVVVVPSTRKLQILNEVATRIWQLCDGRSVDEITDAIHEEFDVGRQAARRDVIDLVEEMAGRGMVEIE